LGLSIKEYSWIAADTTFLKHAHNPKGGGQLTRTVENTIHYPTEIGPYAMVGVNAKILLQAFYIGKEAVIGHSAVVGSSVGDYAIQAGNPAKIIRYNIDLAYQLEPEEQIEKNKIKGERTIPYEEIINKAKNQKNVIIFGAEKINTIISAAQLFKNVTAVDCCKGRVIPLLEKLTEHQIRNVCLQSLSNVLSYELEYKKDTSVIWLYPIEEQEIHFQPLYEAIEKSGSVIFVQKTTQLYRRLSSSSCFNIDLKFKSRKYSIFIRKK